LPEVLNDGEVLLRLDGATICNSDVHTMTGRRKEPTPGVLGHEGCGEVVRSARPGITIGERLTFSVTDVCGKCEFSRRGPQQKCVKLTKIGHVKYELGTVPRGCYSTHILLGPGTALVRLPPVLDTELATPVNCALATMVAARRVARHALDIERTANMEPREQQSVIIYGAGLLGLYGCALFKEDGFKVYISDPVAERVKQAVNFGAEDQMNETEKVDLIVEVCGYAPVVTQGISRLRPGGAAVLVGCVTPDTALSLTGDMMVRGCVTMIGIHNYHQQDLTTSVQFLEQSPYREEFRKVVSPPQPMEDFEQAFQLAKTGKYQRVLLKM